jgi:hypothetical protein
MPYFGRLPDYKKMKLHNKIEAMKLHIETLENLIDAAAHGVPMYWIDDLRKSKIKQLKLEQKLRTLEN